MERETRIPLAVRFRNLRIAVRFRNLTNDLESGRKTTLNDLDEYFSVGIEYFRQEALKGGEDHEGWARKAMQFETLKKGSYRKEKWMFCIASRKALIEEAFQFEAAGKPTLAEARRNMANNWEALATACRQVPEGR